jgi:steroid delta-isomerase-like uncharacterized protein
MKAIVQVAKKTWIIFTIILLLNIFGCKQPVPEGLSDEEANAILEKTLKVYNEGNLDLVDETVATENKLHHSAYPEDIIGIEDFKEYITNIRTAFPDMKLTFDEKVFKGYKIMTRWTFTGTNTGSFREMPPTDKQVSYSGLSLSHLKDGKFVESWIIYNGLEFYKQLGFSLMPPEEETEEEPEM